jgi:nicotinamidase/pyrazinamidase
MKKVLIIVDVQNDFAHPAGALYVKGGEKVALAVEQLVKEKANNYDLIIATADWHSENDSSFKENGGTWPRHCVQNTWGASLLLSDWTQKQIEFVVGKVDYSGFGGFSVRDPFRLSISEILTAKWEKKEIVVDIVGLALDWCVKATAIDSHKAGFKTRILLEYTGAVNLEPDDDKKAIKEMEKEGVEIIE